MAQGIGGAAAIRGLLDDLHAELSAYPPELDEPKSLEDIMWNLERLGLRNSSASARSAAAAALGATSLDQLEVLLEVDADWHPVDGMWSVHEVQQSRAGAAGAEHLKTLRETAAGAVTPTHHVTHRQHHVPPPCGLGFPAALAVSLDPVAAAAAKVTAVPSDRLPRLDVRSCWQTQLSSSKTPGRASHRRPCRCPRVQAHRGGPRSPHVFSQYLQL